MKKLTLLCASTALVMPAMVHAQSTGSIEFENNEEIVVTGTRTSEVGGIQVPDSAKTRQVLTSDIIQRQVPGQSVNEIINLIPGVSFQNQDPYGSSGGTLTIRGFDATRISQTFDGIPLNDTGNYALYSNQQLDPELIEQVNVNLGTTEVDSPTAAASGSTVNYRTRNPTEDFHVRLQGSIGDWQFFRVFGVIDTGTFTPFGTRAFVAVSHSQNENPYQRTSKTDKWQYNAKVYQPIGDNGDFISVAGHWNQNRNGNFSSIPLRTDLTQSATNQAPRVVGSAAGNRFPTTRDERDYTLAPCQTDTPQPGVADAPNTCGTLFDYSFNPSNTGNVRINSRFTLADGLVLTVDPSIQYTKANGGSGAVRGNEGFYRTNVPTPLTGYIGGQPYFGGVDLNGDGDTLDSVELYAPSQTVTHRYGVIANLRYDISPTQTVRVNYTHDYGRHRQTGEIAYLQSNGHTTQYFPINNPLLDADGNLIEKRNRKSYAILNQVSGEYRGEFFDRRLTVNLGVRAPFFKRELNNYCVTETGGSFVDCFADPADQAVFLAARPGFVPPIKKTLKFNKVLPTGGVTFDFADHMSLYASYTKGLQVPGTDNLYQSLGFTAGQATPRPETSDNFDLGWRYRSSKIQAQVAGWYTNFSNRLAQSYDPILDMTVYRNLGTVHKYGVDANIAYTPVRQLTLYAFGSYLKSKILDDVQLGECNAVATTNCSAPGQPIYAPTAGKREAGAPTYTFGGRVQGNLGPLELGVQAKRTGPRYVNDQNLPILQCTVTLVNSICPANGVSYQVYGAKTPAYTIVDLDARLSLKSLGLNDRTWLQLNVTNLFDKLYVAGFTGNTARTNVPFAYVGAPRTVSATLVVGF